MFTSEPSLAQRIERMIGETPKIDPHSRIRCDQPAAPDLATLLEYHPVQSELRAVGMPVDDLDPSLPADERVRLAIPYLTRMRNTATAWCFYRILRDLYDVYEPNLTESNYRDVFDKVAASAVNPEWPAFVLEDRCKLETIVTSLGNRVSDSANNSKNVLFALDADYLFCPGVAVDLGPFFTDRTRKSEYYEAIADAVGERPTTPDRLALLLEGWLDRTVTGPVRFTRTFLPIEQRFPPVDESHTRAVLEKAAQGRELFDVDIDSLTRSVTRTVLGWHHENRKALQITFGAEFDICDGKSIPRHDPSWVTEMSRAFYHFGNARFDLMAASELAAQETAVLARQFPNVYLSGDWWHNLYPDTVEKSISRRVQTTPMSKFGAFASAAPSVEWTYGRLQLVKKATASALAKLVATGYHEEDEIPPILRQIFYQTPLDLHDLGPR